MNHPLDNNTPEGQNATTTANADKAENNNHSDDGEYQRGIQLTLVLIALLLSMFLVALDMTIVATAIPRITDDFHSLDQVGWYGSAFFLTLASLQALWGKGYKYFNLKTTFLLSVFIFEMGSLTCAVSRNGTTLVAGRAIQGAGGAGITGGCYTIIAFTVPPASVPTYTGLIGAVFSIASVAGPLLGGVFTQELSWRWCFYVNLPIGGLAIILLIFFFRTPSHARPVAATWREISLQMDLIGVTLLLASLISSSALFSFLSGKALGRVGHFFPFLLVGSLLAVTGAALLYTLDMNSTVGQFIGYQIVFGVAVGSCIQVPIMAATALADPADIPVVTAVILFFQLVSGAVSVSAAQSVFTNRLIASLPRYAPDVSVPQVVAVGATEIRSTFPSSQVQGILRAYMAGLKAAWAMGIGLAVLPVILSFCPQRVSIKNRSASAHVG
ncbi:hypothetical protein UA08_05288 [Talaromyces atroroseus]|uniref:Major facilitator superfamily (MFS) profile domain-containing protein n=1 Tax=Talaromyces atroroseus TaxID=1441469 RepID=A0A225AWW0_TALAT|nr:hypothetical protein UA08_05288 [Talaromyces atroroseus]OKL59456.1 hypothetical protein UA08_05288 [Talaromyces atroroseus]